MSGYEFTCTVDPCYLPEQSQPELNIYAFSYTVRIVNTGKITAQLISRHWIIIDAHGHVEQVKGLGVVGYQPLLKPGESFEYSSWTRLTTSKGTMSGSFFCVAEDGERFDAMVPAFSLTMHRNMLH